MFQKLKFGKPFEMTLQNDFESFINTHFEETDPSLFVETAGKAASLLENRIKVVDKLSTEFAVLDRSVKTLRSSFLSKVEKSYKEMEKLEKTSLSEMDPEKDSIQLLLESNETIEVLTEQSRVLSDLNIARHYLQVVQKVEFASALSLKALQNLQSVEKSKKEEIFQKAFESFFDLSRYRCNRNDCVPTEAIELDRVLCERMRFLLFTKRELIGLREMFAKAMYEAAKEIGFPTKRKGVFTQYEKETTELARFDTAFSRLVQLQVAALCAGIANDSSSSSIFSLICKEQNCSKNSANFILKLRKRIASTKSTEWWALSELWKSILRNFSFHFLRQDTETSRLDRPKWCFTFAFDQFESAEHFLGNYVAPLLDASISDALQKLFNIEVPPVSSNSSSPILSLVSSLSKCLTYRLRCVFPQLCGDSSQSASSNPQAGLLCSTVEALLEYEKMIRKKIFELDDNDQELYFQENISIVPVLITNKQWLESWLKAERLLVARRLEALLDAPKSWKFVCNHQNKFVEMNSFLRSAGTEGLLTLMQVAQERVELLPLQCMSERLRLRNAMHTPLLAIFLDRVEMEQSRFQIASPAQRREGIGQNADENSASPPGSWIRMCVVFSSLYFAWNILRSWNEKLFSLRLSQFLERERAAKGDFENFGNGENNSSMLQFQSLFYQALDLEDDSPSQSKKGKHENEVKGIYADDIEAIHIRLNDVASQMATCVVSEFVATAQWQNFPTLCKGLSALAALGCRIAPYPSKMKQNHFQNQKKYTMSPEIGSAVDNLKSQMTFFTSTLGDNSATSRMLEKLITLQLQKWILDLIDEGIKKAVDDFEFAHDFNFDEKENDNSNNNNDTKREGYVALQQLYADCHAIFSVFPKTQYLQNYQNLEKKIERKVYNSFSPN
eukprot:g4031.t1